MQRLQTKTAEQIYSVLEKYVDASSKYYDREGFIYCFGVVPNLPSSFELECMDGRKKTVFRKENEIYMIGKGSGRINSIIKKIMENADNAKIAIV